VAPAAAAPRAGGGAAGVAALMAIPLVGTAFHARESAVAAGGRRSAPSASCAALIGGFVGWRINRAFDHNLIRLVVPKEPPRRSRWRSSPPC
jgi:H+/Cl- antiporter ClcA